jgi:hypothetical protein
MQQIDQRTAIWLHPQACLRFGRRAGCITLAKEQLSKPEPQVGMARVDREGPPVRRRRPRIVALLE